MRLDLFLKVSRLVPRRTVAQNLCDVGAVLVNDLPAKSSRSIKAGDCLTLRLGKRQIVVRVVNVPETKCVKTPTALYERISEAPIEHVF
ncbi:MAG: RNA-binding S4 domain-containing protein [Chloracidobacterium sp.]|uniref:RNA-binding S4 domain-containing protein n=1 Tax=Chloracidobacterium validum TaxID=2821543 RepID=A0ABX8BAJ7_9BACT|nr:RNA-binding S4 domain-containing protein [Chloracidobacterium validum]QUW02085.1 RNA-binding S4 domain-containing protein [Chloracidobacterium validum]